LEAFRVGQKQLKLNWVVVACRNHALVHKLK